MSTAAALERRSEVMEVCTKAGLKVLVKKEVMGIIRIQDCQSLGACLHLKLTNLLTLLLLCISSRKLLF